MFSFKKFVTAGLVSLMLFGQSIPVIALDSSNIITNPDSMSLSPAGFTDATPIVTITSNSNPSTINRLEWSEFNVDSVQTVRFVFSESNQAILNYVPFPTNAEIWTVIEGIIETRGEPGTLMIINPNGVFFRGGEIVSLNNGNLFVSDLALENQGTFFNPGNVSINTPINFIEYRLSSATIDGVTYNNLLKNGFELRNNSSISDFDRVTMLADGLRIGVDPDPNTSVATISANDNVQILTAGPSTYRVDTDTFPTINGSTLPNLNICYDTGTHTGPNPGGPERQYDNSFANFTLGPNSSITVSSGNVSIRNVADQNIYDSSIDIQGTVSANATAAGEGEIFISSENQGSEIGFINLTGTLNSTAPCPITPPVTLDADNVSDGEIRSIDYDVSFSDTPFIDNTGAPISQPGKPTPPPATLSQGTINMKEFPDLTLASDTQTFPNTVTGVNQRTVDLGAGATEGELEVNLDPCVTPPPSGGGGGGAAAAIAIPLGVAGAAGIGSLLFAPPLLTRSPLYEPTVVMRPYYVCPEETYVCTPEGYQRATRYRLRPAYSQTTGAAAPVNQGGYYYYPQRQVQPGRNR